MQMTLGSGEGLGDHLRSLAVGNLVGDLRDVEKH